MRSMVFALLPLALLLALAVVACVLGYGVLHLISDELPLAKVISKTTQILLLLSIFPLKKILNLNWSDFGFTAPARFFKQMGQGLMLALITLLPVLLILYFLDVHVWDGGRTWTAGKVFEKVGLGLFLAMLIAIGEELLFRGLLFGSLRHKLPVCAAIVISSFYYAALHFLKSKTQIPYDQQTFASGFELMAEAFANWLNPNIISALIALFMVGVFLAVLRSRVPQSLGLCVGCHAGWVWQIKVSKDLCNVNPESDYLYLVSAYDGVVGPLVSLWLAVAIGVWLWVRRVWLKKSLVACRA
ncbi:CPBP family intramembrane metalloprotease [Methylomonas sp. LL1]|uniref:CPBP family intramembrane glutamic endopeptidase n=1 Tax=Methylomonas sp. LL1 TaxID=2785785 RepID=UPI0018C3984C|nr:type II CAAX endopeptidase family protein [Methylomonas sp. LL1]QPK63474.1 CPBP family intramembrane metalloprotease [Methylomonas sp. LL1]